MNTATYLALERRVGVYWTSGTATFRSRRLKLEKLNVSGAGKTPQQKRRPIRSALKNGGAGVRDGSLSLKPRRCFPCLSG